MEKTFTKRTAYPEPERLVLEIDPILSDPVHPSGYIFAFSTPNSIDYRFAGGAYAFSIGKIILRTQFFKEVRMQYAMMLDLEIKAESVYDSMDPLKWVLQFDLLGPSDNKWDSVYHSLYRSLYYKKKFTHEQHLPKEQPIIFGKDIRSVALVLTEMEGRYTSPISDS